MTYLLGSLLVVDIGICCLVRSGVLDIFEALLTSEKTNVYKLQAKMLESLGGCLFLIIPDVIAIYVAHLRLISSLGT